MTNDACSQTTNARRSLAAATVLALLVALMWPTPAAAGDTVTWADVQGPLDDGCLGTVGSPVEVTLPASVVAPSNTLTVGCVAVLDLNGHDLMVANVVIAFGEQLTIRDSDGGGTLTADSSDSYRAGIRTSSATLIIESGTVKATGRNDMAGIGGDIGGSGGTVMIAGGTVHATGGNGAAGIGGGWDGNGGGAVDVGSGAVVIATGGYTAIGGGQGSPFGSLTVAGTLHLPSGSLVVPLSGSAASEITIEDGGRILGGTGNLTVGADFVGDGRIANGGVIALDAAHVTSDHVEVTGHHYDVAFETDGGTPTPGNVTVFAPSFEDGERDFPADPTREGGLAFRGWTDKPGGTGHPITATSTLHGSSFNGVPAAITAYAHWVPAADVTTSTITADPTSITANGNSTSTITVQAKDAGAHDLTVGGDTVTLTTTAGTLSKPVIDNDDGTYTATLTSAKTAGTATIAGELNGTKIVDDATVNFTAIPSTSTPTDPEPTDPEPDEGPLAPVFDDVSKDSVHADAIDRIVRYGITVGTSDTTFDPSGDLSRGQMATFIVRLLTLTDPSIEQPADHDAAMALLVDRGLLLGDVNGDLDGVGTLTRGQAASLLVRLTEQVTGEVLPASGTQFSDVAATSTHAENIAKLVELGVIKGLGDGTYRPGTDLRRDQMASLISRTLDILIAAGHIEDLDT